MNSDGVLLDQASSESLRLTLETIKGLSGNADKLEISGGGDPLAWVATN